MERFWGYARVIATAAPPIPAATITVYDAGTLNAATIYSDNIATPKANPFTAGSDGFFFFYAANGRYDVVLSGGGITTPYTWADVLLLDSASGFLQTLNAQAQAVQTLVAGTAGVDFAISSAAGVHTFNLPNAGAAARGVVSTGAQTFAGAKTFSTPIAAGSGGTGLDGSAAANGKVLIGNGAGYTLANLTAGANAGVTITNGAGSITLSTVQDIRTTASPTFNDVVLGTTDPTNGPILTVTNWDVTYGGLVRIEPGGNGRALLLRDGSLPVGVDGSDPVAGTITAGTGISVLLGPGLIRVSNSGVTSLACGGLTAQTGALSLLTTTSAAAAPAWSAFAGGFTLNIPPAGSGTTFGLVTDAAQTIGGQKTFAAHPIIWAGSSAGKQTSYAVGVPAPAIGVGNVGAGEDTLATFTLAAATMDTDDVSAIEIAAWCYCAANGNSKTIKLYFGSTVLVTVAAAATLNDAPVKLEALVLRKSATAQTAIGEGRAKAAAAAASAYTVTSQSVTAPGETLANDVTIKVTGEAVANDDIVCRALIVKVLTA